MTEQEMTRRAPARAANGRFIPRQIHSQIASETKALPQTAGPSAESAESADAPAAGVFARLAPWHRPLGAAAAVLAILGCLWRGVTAVWTFAGEERSRGARLTSIESDVRDLKAGQNRTEGKLDVLLREVTGWRNH